MVSSHEDPERTQTHLPGVVELLDRQTDGKVEVGVGEHDQRRLAAELERQRDDVGAAARAMTPAVGTEPVNASRLMSGCAVSGAPASTPVPCTTLSTPAGSPASCAMSAKQGCRQRRPLRRLEHHGVARGKGGADAPGGEHERSVPRCDDRDDAGRVVA